VRAEPRRSFDDIAAEILRPMLQDWLDNNLPTLVERLVREEIERVVRGDR
jgi:cell pole-organizing protein PopZ